MIYVLWVIVLFLFVSVGYLMNRQNDYISAIKHNAMSVKQPTEKPWGQVVAYVRDINGCLIAFGSPMGNE